MIFIGLLAVFVVIVQSCQSPKTGIDRYGVKSLRALTVLDNAPLQPSLEFNSPSGKTMTLSDYHGKVVLLNAWATWCPPCVAEMPSLNRLQNLRGGDDFQVVTISLDNKKAEITEFFERNNIDALPDWHDGTYAINGRLRLPGLPTTVLYDRQGRELARLSGEAEWDSDEALALVDYLLAQ
jgi:thiol-disulfide isomerase/thioredoxin